jgi:hypothetical protein
MRRWLTDFIMLRKGEGIPSAWKMRKEGTIAGDSFLDERVSPRLVQKYPLQAARRRQTTEEFQERYAARAGIESTHEQAKRRCGCEELYTCTDARCDYV